VKADKMKIINQSGSVASIAKNDEKQYEEEKAGLKGEIIVQKEKQRKSRARRV